MVDQPVVSPPGQGRSKTARRRRNRKRPQVVIEKEVVLPKPSRADRRRTRRANAAITRTLPLHGPIARGQVRDPFSRLGRNTRTAGFTVSERDFVRCHLDPCGEYSTSILDARVPDGAVPQSSALGLREIMTVRVPTSDNSNVPLDGNMWTLVVFHWPMMRTPLVMIASVDNSEPTREQVRQVYEIISFHPDIDSVTFPTWSNVEGGLYFCVVQWTALRNMPPPTEDTQWIKQYRITADGITIFDNTPDLVNQGIVVGAQFNVDKTDETVVPSAGSGIGSLSISAGAASRVVSLTLPDGSAGSVGVPIIDSAGAGQILITTNNDMVIGNTPVPAESTINANITFTSGGITGMLNWTLILVYSGSGLLTLSGTLNMPTIAASKTFIVTNVDPVSDFNHHVVEIPSSSQQSITQETAKTVQMTMKEENGVYMVKRVWQPVFNLQSYLDRKPVRFVNRAGSNLGLSDSFDPNYGVGVIVAASLPHACAPAIKIIRIVEIVAGQNSPYGPFMTATPPRNEIIQTLIRDFSEQAPFMYPESFNTLNKLLGVVEGVLNKFPKVLANAPIIGDIVSSVFGSLTQGSKSVNTRNKLMSLEGCDNLEEVISRLLSRLAC